MLGTCLENVRNTVPLVHNITNYVTVNDVANILLACGGSPIMSDEPEDARAQRRMPSAMSCCSTPSARARRPCARTPPSS